MRTSQPSARRPQPRRVPPAPRDPWLCDSRDPLAWPDPLAWRDPLASRDPLTWRDPLASRDRGPRATR
ncbi:MAG TPA: hypothetical protein VGI00_02760 [Streptosporangiaceae bacterium]